MSTSLPLRLPDNKDSLPIRINLSEHQQTELFSSWKMFVPDLYITEEYTSSLYDAQNPGLKLNGQSDQECSSDDDDDDDDDDGLEENIYGCSCSSSPCCDLTISASSGNTDDCQCIGNFFISFDGSTPTPILHLPHPAHLPLVECGPLCHPKSDGNTLCKNQISKTPIFPFLELRSSPVSSFGIFTTHPIPKGAFICTYAGELITSSSARNRWLARSSRTNVAVDHPCKRTEESSEDENTCMNGEMNYIFCLRLGVNDVYIDAGSIGGIGRFFNHSHSPNIIPLPTFQPPSPRFQSFRRTGSLSVTPTVMPETNASTGSTKTTSEATMTPRIGFFANRRISVGEELCWDYGDGASLSASSSNVISSATAVADHKSEIRREKLEHLDADRKGVTGRKVGEGAGRLPCFCQSENCDGYLPFDDNL